MKKITNPIKAQIVVRPCHPALKIALTVLIVFSTAALLALGWVHGAIADQTEVLRDEAAAVEFANAKMEGLIQDPDAVDNVRQVAQEVLGLVDPDTVVIEPRN